MGRVRTTQVTITAIAIFYSFLRGTASPAYKVPTGITWYEHLFFNIFDRLQARSYISHKVTRLLYLKPDDPLFLPAFWMEIGYCAGPSAVDLLVEFQDRILEPLTREDLLPPQDVKESILRNIKLLINMRTTLYDTSTYQPLLDARGILELADREEQTKIMIQQTQAIQALSAPLANMPLEHEDMHLGHDSMPLEHADMHIDHADMHIENDNMHLEHDSMNLDHDMHLEHDSMDLEHNNIPAQQDLSGNEFILPITAHETAQKLVI